MRKSKNRGHEYVLIAAMLVIIFGCFAAAMTTAISNDAGNKTSVGAVSTFDLDITNEYSLVETDGKNGIRYYVITKNETNSTTAAAWPDGSEAEVTAVAATTQTTPFPSITAPPTTTQPPRTEQNDNRRVAYLTFDDGPSENTEKILDILDEYGVKATFFVIYHKNMESRYREIVARGHTIALHSYTHNYRKVYSSEAAYFDDLEKIHDYVYDVTGVDSNIVRFPGGSSNTVSNKYCKDIMKTLKKDVVARGYVYHDWNVDSTDASGNNIAPEILLDNVKARLTKNRKSNILMHDTGEMKQTTVQALPSIIEYIRSQGYEMERITEDSKVITHG